MTRHDGHTLTAVVITESHYPLQDGRVEWHAPRTITHARPLHVWCAECREFVGYVRPARLGSQDETVVVE